MGQGAGKRSYFLRLEEGEWEWEGNDLWLVLFQAQREMLSLYVESVRKVLLPATWSSTAHCR